jgi:hypothetical protein
VLSELGNNPKLAARLTGLLPKGTNLQEAAEGFEHARQLASVVHVSVNLRVPFDLLKFTMKDGSLKQLRKAIEDLRPSADASAEAKKADRQAKEDMKG